MKSEMPSEAGWPWAVRHSVTVNGVNSTAWTAIGGVRAEHGTDVLIFRSGNGSVTIRQDTFDQFDWHKIELPEGWR